MVYLKSLLKLGYDLKVSLDSNIYYCCVKITINAIFHKNYSRVIFYLGDNLLIRRFYLLFVVEIQYKKN